jgi:hypothetical protein
VEREKRVEDVDDFIMFKNGFMGGEGLGLRKGINIIVILLGP